MVDAAGKKKLVAGSPWVYVDQVSTPTITHGSLRLADTFEVDREMNPDIRVTSKTPPTFLLQAEDDPVDPVENSLVYDSALRKAGVAAEIHVFVKGGHAFGLRPTESPITGWPKLVETWLLTIGIISK